MVESKGNFNGKSACFTGHRRIGSGELPTLKQRLDEVVEKLIRQGVTTFHCGGALGFDSLAGNAVLGFKAKYNTVRLVMVLPCTDQDKSWAANDKEAYSALLSGADEVIYVTDKTYFNGCMKLRNARLVEESDFCIAYMKHTARSGTAQTVRMAKEKGIPVINLAEGADCH